MKTTSLVLGILSICGMFFGFFPCLGWFNWFNLPIAIIGLIFGILGYTANDNEPKSNAIAGTILCLIALFFSTIRLFVGVGIF